ncbi:MAG: hypothetical protein COT85_01195 [Chlamydiae bacterium CG10_big_fil_rev_8_21_14_0_10_42_34]|nr:MAG: hypothetical protein COT85_01195 [Chlamydiae bacterium CG10_big_fil_rev_8_21_14_0_10_42_34]
MDWTQVERSFSRAVANSFSKKKIMLTFPVLILCGILVVFCRAVANDASAWVSMSLAFLPILLSSGILLALGVLLIRIHAHEVKGLRLSFRRLISGSVDLIMGTSYLSIPTILVYLFLWMALGIFFLLGQIPGIGEFFSVVFAFAPFLLIFGSLLLCIVNLGLLFFVAPAAAFQPLKRTSLAKRVLGLFKGRLLSSIALFLLALVPIALVSGLLSLSAILTNVHATSDQSLAVAIEWFFIMIPFAAVLTPAVIFFFNFAAESHQLLHPQTQ